MAAGQPLPSKQILREIAATLSQDPQQAIILYEDIDWTKVSSRAKKLHQSVKRQVNTARKQLMAEATNKLKPLLQNHRYATADAYAQSIRCKSIQQHAQQQLISALTLFEENLLKLLVGQRFQQFQKEVYDAEITPSLHASLDSEMNRAISKLQANIEQQLEKYYFKTAQALLSQASLPINEDEKLTKKITAAQAKYIKQIQHAVQNFQFTTAHNLLEACQLKETLHKSLIQAIKRATEAKITEINLLMTEFQFTQINTVLSKTEFDQATTEFLVEAIWASKAKQLELFDTALAQHDFATSQFILRHLELSKENDRYQKWQTQLITIKNQIQQHLFATDSQENFLVFNLLEKYQLPQYLHEKFYSQAYNKAKKIFMDLLESTPCNFRDALQLLECQNIPTDLQSQFRDDIVHFREHHEQQFQDLLEKHCFKDAAKIFDTLILPEAGFKALLLQLHQAQSKFIADIHGEALADRFEDYSIIEHPSTPYHESDDEFELLEPHAETLAHLVKVVNTKQFYALTENDHEILAEIKATYPDSFVEAITEVKAIFTSGIFANSQIKAGAHASPQHKLHT